MLIYYSLKKKSALQTNEILQKSNIKLSEGFMCKRANCREIKCYMMRIAK